MTKLQLLDLLGSALETKQTVKHSKKDARLYRIEKDCKKIDNMLNLQLIRVSSSEKIGCTIKTTFTVLEEM